MKLAKSGYEILTPINGEEILKHLERIGRVCYKSETNITSTSAEKFIQSIIASGHESVIEHFSISVKFIVDRGISHEIVRHRIASFSQESTRYCNYSKDKYDNQITVIEPYFWKEGSPEYTIWRNAGEYAEYQYRVLLESGETPERARSVLPNSLKTELVMTANLREWRHFFILRCYPDAHPQMREVAIPLLMEFHRRIPIIFDDIMGDRRVK